MAEQRDTNAEIWKSEEIVKEWARTQSDRDAQRVEHWRLLAKLLPFGVEESFTFADLGAGAGAASSYILDRYPRATAMLTDYSPQMITAGTEALARFAGRFRYIEFDMLEGTWPDELGDGIDAVVTSLCVHHLPDERKQWLFGEIRAHLRPVGWYLNYDPITASSEATAKAWERVGDLDDPTAPERRAHRSETEQARYENHVRYMIPLAPQLGWLEDAGFDGVDVYWKYLDNVIYGGVRPA